MRWHDPVDRNIKAWDVDNYRRLGQCRGYDQGFGSKIASEVWSACSQ